MPRGIDWVAFLEFKLVFERFELPVKALDVGRTGTRSWTWSDVLCLRSANEGPYSSGPVLSLIYIYIVI